MVPPPLGDHPPDPQFLSSVLSQRGPSALPYSEDTKWLIRQHLLSLTSTFPSLDPKTASFTHNDGRCVNLLQADGTIPMNFQGVTYNIPIIIWLMESYPRQSPCVYVNPTRDMLIKRPHPYVNPSGMVSVPYLQNWIYPSSNLVDLARNLSVAFGRDPPLYSQRRAPPPPSPTPNSNSYGSPSSNSSNLGSSSSYAHPPIPPRTYSASSYGSGGAASPARVQSSPHKEDSSELHRRNAINKLVEMIHNDVSRMRKAREVEMEGLISLQGVLRQKGEQHDKGLKEMRGEMESLEQQLQVVLMNADVLEGWLTENQGKKKKMMGDSDQKTIDDAFKCVDVLSKQMLECTATDLAIEDAVYTLDRAVQMGAIPFDQYIRNVRAVSREQFFHRATAAKIRAAQLQDQVADMAARISHFVN